MQLLGDYNNAAGVTQPYYITLTMNLPTLQAVFTTTNGYQVDFRAATSVASLVGFNNILLGANTSSYSTKSLNILPFETFNITCNICSGFIVLGNQSDVLFSFPNDFARGSQIVVKPNPVIPCIVNTKFISYISVSFYTETRQPIYFKSEELSLLIVIEQM